MQLMRRWGSISNLVGGFRDSPWRTTIAAGEVAVLMTILVLEFRNAFSYGVLVTPDLFRSFPAVPSFNNVGIYLSKWNPADLGSESAEPSGAALLGAAAAAGIVGSALEAAYVLLFTGFAVLAIWLLVRPYLHEPLFAPIAPVLYLLSPTLFIMIFDANIQFVLFALLPALLLLTRNLSERPSWRGAILMGMTLALACAFVPFTPLLILPAIIVLIIAGQLANPSKRRLCRTGLLAALSLGVAVALNAPYYIGNLTYLSGQGIAGAVEANRPVVSSTYGWSSPPNLLSIVGAGLYPRYASFYPTWATAFLLVLPCIAFIGIVPAQRAKGRDLRLALGLLAAASLAWVSATQAGLTGWVFEAVPYLLVFNYPAVFYLFIALAFVVLSVLATDDLHAWARSMLGDRHAVPPSHPPPVEGRAARNRAKVVFLRNLGVMIALVLVITSAAPAGFYLSSGDFRVLDAPSRMGFPAPWTANAPRSFERISAYLQAHGGDILSRALVLPAPAFSGGNTLPGYSLNLFNQKQYQNSSYTGPFFLVPSAQQYATAVLDYLIANRTQEIGLALGQASVRFVFVDKELNFTGPPRWEWDSLVGSPGAFLELLNGQEDLRMTYEDPLLTVYENLDFRPYVQPYVGVTLLRSGSPAVQVEETVSSWSFEKSGWGSPLPENQIGGLSQTRDGYLVTAPGGAGSVAVQFSSDPVDPGLTSVSPRFDTTGIYLTSAPETVGDYAYAVSYETSYVGPSPHEGGLLFVAGWNANLSFLWQTAPCCSAPPGRSFENVSFDPTLLDPNTVFVTVTAMLPYEFGDASIATFKVSNVSLIATTRPPPTTMLAPLLLGQLPTEYQPRLNAAVLWDGLSPQDQSQVDSAGVRPDRLCLGLCPLDGSGPWDQLILAYDSLGPASNASIRHRDPQALSGVAFDAQGTSSEGLMLAGYPFRTIYVRARGNGSIIISSGKPIVIDSVEYAWYSWSGAAVSTNTSVPLSLVGALQIDAFLVTGMPPVAGPRPSGLGNATFSQVSFTDYRGEWAGGAGALLLSQSFNPGWSVRVGSTHLTPLKGIGWATLFVLPSAAGNSSMTFEISFGPQAAHESLVAVQALSLALATFFVVLPEARRARVPARRLWRWLISMGRP